MLGEKIVRTVSPARPVAVSTAKQEISYESISRLAAGLGEMVFVAGITFQMGDINGSSNEKPAHDDLPPKTCPVFKLEYRPRFERGNDGKEGIQMFY